MRGQQEVCPIVEINRGKLDHPNVTFARDYYRAVGSWVSIAPQKVSVNSITTGKKELGIGFVDSVVARAVDTVCYDYLQKEQRLVESYRFDTFNDEKFEIQFNSLMQIRYLLLFKDGQVTVESPDKDVNVYSYPSAEWKQKVAQKLSVDTLLQPYKYNLVSMQLNPQVRETNLKSIDNLVEYVKTGDIGLTLLVIYSIYASL